MDRESLWLLLYCLGIPDKMAELLKELYSELLAVYWQIECGLGGLKSSVEAGLHCFTRPLFESNGLDPGPLLLPVSDALPHTGANFVNNLSLVPLAVVSTVDSLSPEHETITRTCTCTHVAVTAA